MNFQNVILRYKGGAEVPAEDISNITSVRQVKVVDSTMLPKMLLLQASEKAISSLQKILADKPWLIVKETQTPIPDTRKKIKNKPVSL